MSDCRSLRKDEEVVPVELPCEDVAEVVPRMVCKSFCNVVAELAAPF